MAKRGDLLGGGPAERLGADIVAALKRKPASETRLAGVVRALAPYSPPLRNVLTDALETLVDRGSYTRPLYAAAVRALADAGEKRSVGELKRALSSEEAGGLATLSAACVVDDAAIAEPLAKVAASRHPHLAFAAEVARISRRESNGAHITSLAPKIKESHRIELCSEVFVPLLRHKPLLPGIAPALAVLRDAERHLGRWLVFAQIATRAGDSGPLDEASERAAKGPESARVAWAMVAWALTEGRAPPPDARPTVELVARLSDRPSSDRDTTFLYRLAEARAPAAKVMLESFARSTSLPNELAVRAALYLVRDWGRSDLCEALGNVARDAKREALRGLAAAALHDAGEREQALSLCSELVQSRQTPTMAWASLLQAAEASKLKAVVDEASFRRVQLGWID